MSSTTTLVVRQCRLRQWGEDIRSCKSRPDGMTVGDWCSQNGMTKASYYYRLKEVRKACLDQLPAEAVSQSIVSMPTELLEATSVEETEDARKPASEITISCGPFCIYVTENMSPELLEKVLRVAADVK